MIATDKFIQKHKYKFKYFEYEVNQSTINIRIPKTNCKITLDEQDIKHLSKNELITNKNFCYHKHYGFTYKEYGEYFLSSEFPFLLSLYDLYGDLGDMLVEFKIGIFSFEFSRVSDIACLLIEPYISKYEYSVADKGLQEYFYTIKISGVNIENHKEAIIKGLYYLNTLFRKKNDIVLNVYNIFSEDYDFKFAERYIKGNIDDDYRENKTLSTIKTTIVKDYKSTEPLQLYIYANTLSGNDKFIAFYRVLEYFFLRSQSYKIDNLRYKKNITSIDLLKEITLKDERTKLFNLLQQVCTVNIQKKIITEYNNYNQKTATITSLKVLSDHIYEFRCSLVHAKEDEIGKTNIPDIFGKQNNNYFINIVEILASASIKKFNLVK